MQRLALITSLIAVSASAQAVCPAREVWPSPDWAEALAPAGDAVRALEAYVFPPTDERHMRTDGVLVLHHGRVIYERYGRGFTREHKHPLRSISKNVSSTLIGVAVREGLVSLDDSVCQHLTEFAGQPQCEVRVIDTLTHGSGLAWQESGFDGVESSLWAMLQGEGHRDQTAFVMGHALAAPPGTRWTYNTGTASLAAAIAQRALEKKYGRDALWKALFEPLGAPGFTLEFDAAGAPIGGSAGYATPRDLARLGYLMLNDGCWNGQRLLPEGWVQNALTPSQVFLHSDEPTGHIEGNGYMWWVNARLPPPYPAELPLPDVPEGSYGATGRWNQLLYVIPSMDLIVVRTADDREADFNRNEFLKRAMALAP